MSQKLCVLTSYYKILRLISQTGWNEQLNADYSKMLKEIWNVTKIMRIDKLLQNFKIN